MTGIKLAIQIISIMMGGSLAFVFVGTGIGFLTMAIEEAFSDDDKFGFNRRICVFVTMLFSAAIGGAIAWAWR